MSEAKKFGNNYGQNISYHNEDPKIIEFITNPLIILFTYAILMVYLYSLSAGYALLGFLVVILSAGIYFSFIKKPESMYKERNEVFVSPNISQSSDNDPIFEDKYETICNNCEFVSPKSASLCMNCNKSLNY